MFDLNNLEVTARLGKLHTVMRVFKSDPHDILGIFAYSKSLEKPIVNLLSTNNAIVPIELIEVKPLPLDKYAKRNIDNLSEEEKIVGIFTLGVKTIDNSLKAEEAPVKIAPVTVTTSEDDDDAYEQISIFDVLEE